MRLTRKKNEGIIELEHLFYCFAGRVRGEPMHRSAAGKAPPVGAEVKPKWRDEDAENVSAGDRR